MTLKWLVLPSLAALAACGGEGEGTSVSIKGDGGNVTASADKDGRVTVKAPGFEGSVTLPRFRLGGDNFSIDGVKLYPGATITSLNVDGDSDGKGGAVRVAFDAPADATQVRDWFREQMEGAGFTVTGNRDELTGKTGKGSPFTLKLAPAGEKQSKGTLNVSGD